MRLSEEGEAIDLDRANHIEGEYGAAVRPNQYEMDDKQFPGIKVLPRHFQEVRSSALLVLPV